MTDVTNLDGVGTGTYEEEAVVSDAQPKFVSALEGFHIAPRLTPRSDARLRRFA
jgi:hypothetical protein